MPLAPQAFDDLYRTHAPVAFRRARRLLEEADAHEVVHDVFLSLLQRPEQFRGKSSMSTYLYSAVTHACLNRIRNGKTRSRLLAEHTQEAAPRDSDAASHPERAFLLREGLARLPDMLAHVAVYYYVDDLTHNDIARIIGCSRRHVGYLLERVAHFFEETEAEACVP